MRRIQRHPNNTARCRRPWPRRFWPARCVWAMSAARAWRCAAGAEESQFDELAVFRERAASLRSPNPLRVGGAAEVGVAKFEHAPPLSKFHNLGGGRCKTGCSSGAKRSLTQHGSVPTSMASRFWPVRACGPCPRHEPGVVPYPAPRKPCQGIKLLMSFSKRMAQL